VENIATNFKCVCVIDLL